MMTQNLQKFRYFLLICTKFTIVYRPIFCNLESTSNLQCNDDQKSLSKCNFLKNYLKFTLWCFPKIRYFRLVCSKITLVYHQYFVIFWIVNQIYPIVMTKNQHFFHFSIWICRFGEGVLKMPPPQAIIGLF